MRRRLFTVASALSLLMGAAMAILWARSYSRPLEIVSTVPIREPDPLIAATDNFPRNCGLVTVIHNRGTLYFQYWRADERPSDYGLRFREPYWLPREEAIQQNELLALSASSARGGLGIRFGRRWGESYLICRDATLTAIFALLPVAWILTTGLVVARAMRRRPGLCRKCGYDLRASTDRCPECGTPVAKKAEAAA